MSWLRTAVNKAVEVGNNNNITRNIKNYADTVVHHAGQAVAEGAKLFQDRIGSHSIRSVRQTVKRLEEAAISCRGFERAMLLRRWLVALKEIEKLSEGSQNSLEQVLASDEAKDTPKRPSLVLYYDSDIGDAPMNFQEVFLQSQALECITISMIIEAPNEEEISLLQEMFRLCLTGGKEVHNAVVSSIQDLAFAFSSYQDEVLVKREELLQFVQSAITGLKTSADLLRSDIEASDLKKKLNKLSTRKEGHDNASEKTAKVTIEALREALADIRNCSTLEKILLKKKSLNNGDSPEIHAQKVDKLKILSESLASSSAKAEKRISDHRLQKEEALTVRVAKANEAEGKEKEIVAEISVLEKQRDELEAELKKVNISLAAANVRLRDVREERDQFNEANNQIVSHLKTKEDELSNSISACRAEAEVLHTWINFLEDTWLIQSTYAETKNKQVDEELEQHEDFFVDLAFNLLSDYKKELTPSISRIGKFVENLKKLNERSEKASGPSDEDAKELNPRKHLEEEYLDYEAKIITTFSVVDNMKDLFCKHETLSRKGDPKVKELFNDIEKLRVEFEAIERPTLEIETPKIDTPNEDMQMVPESTQPKPDNTKAKTEAQPLLDPAAELAKLESEFGKGSQDYLTEEIGDWEFDELERELRAGDTAPGK
ncbi:hypothetical protein ERO13_D10G218200v2 [Gossypium hirsutum]|uniref:Uncharacterized protein isoform X1 n=2 Tax=Gossypium hirsutum TaxID=3635 RepID=A0A1U8LTP0_GOSHI|nr:uncharacterized protein LOC107930732 isoform X1 [Gossypium hirsutum]KAG4127486.1 hypothetical protein ERO13_D10G218200v2 [Gossypium hirsutum]